MTKEEFLSKYENTQVYNLLEKQLKYLSISEGSGDFLKECLSIYDKNLNSLNENQKIYLINFLNEIKNYEEFDFTQKELENIKWNAFKIALNTINTFFENNPKNQKPATVLFEKSDKNYKKKFLDFFIDKKYLERKKYFFYSLYEMTGQKRDFLPPSNTKQEDLFPHLFLLLCDKSIQLKDIKVYFESIYEFSKKNNTPNIGQILNNFTFNEQKKIFHNKNLLKLLRTSFDKGKSISKEEVKDLFQALIDKDIKKQIKPKNKKLSQDSTEILKKKSIQERNFLLAEEERKDTQALKINYTKKVF